MIVDKPPWVTHSGTPIFSVDISSDGRRFATAGQDHKVKVWNSAPLLDVNSEADKDLPKLLATLGDHFGPVNVVRFSRSGKQLASGADDKLVCIYELGSGPGKSTFGTSDGINYENWKHTHPLRGHQNNVTDLAWAPDDKFIASCSLDNLVIIWDGHSGQRLKTLEGHTSYVKGVSWDPIGKYLASQSDDQSILVWKTDDWTLVHRIDEPFKVHVSSTFSLRLDWSPDGTYLLAVNSCNNPLHTAVALKRAGWKSEYSLVGHVGPVVVARHSHKLFYAKGPDGKPTDAATTCVALGSTDKRVSVWLTNTKTAVCALKTSFEQSVYDLAWTPDGYSLLAASSDGTVALLQFDADEVGKQLSEMDTEQLLKQMYGNAKATATVFAESAAQLQLEEASVNPHAMPEVPAGLSATERLQSLDARLGGGVSRAALALPRNPPAATTTRKLPEQVPTTATTTGPIPATKQDQRLPDGVNRHDQKMPEVREKRRAEPMPVGVPPEESGAKRVQPERISPARVGNAVREQVHPSQPPPSASPSPALGPDSTPRLPMPAISKSLVCKLGSETAITGQAQPSVRMLESTNQVTSWSGRPTCEVVCTEGGKMLWNDRLVGNAIQLTGSMNFSAVALDSGVVQVYTPAGRRLLPPMKLSSPAAFLCCDNTWKLLLVGTDATMKAWDLNRQKLVLQGSVASLLHRTPHQAKPVSLSTVRFTSSGCVLAVLSSRHAYVYHQGMGSWMGVADDAFPASAFHTMLSLGGKGMGELTSLQSSLHQNQPLLPSVSVGAGSDASYQQSRSHLEVNMAAALAMEAPQDYRRWLLTYSRHLADGGDELRLREVCNELLGPAWYRPTAEGGEQHANGASPSSPPQLGWKETILDLNKRALLHEVLREISRNRANQRLVNEFTEILQEIEGDTQPMVS